MHTGGEDAVSSFAHMLFRFSISARMLRVRGNIIGNARNNM